jgi:rusticyanin
MVGGRKVGWMAAIAIATTVVVTRPAGAQPYGNNQSGYGPMGPGMMGGYGIGPGMMYGAFNRPVYPGWGGGVMNYGQATGYIRQSNAIGQADPKNNTVTYSGRDIVINMVAVQPGHDDQTFEVHGLTNPTLVVPAGAVVHMNLVNMDYGNNMEHGVIITPVPPPYSFMSMMETGPGLAAVMPLLPWRSSETEADAQYASLGATFVARQPGTYWYVCPTPEHAEEGMYGKFIVR